MGKQGRVEPPHHQLPLLLLLLPVLARVTLQAVQEQATTMEPDATAAAAPAAAAGLSLPSGACAPAPVSSALQATYHVSVGGHSQPVQIEKVKVLLKLFSRIPA
jgi:hypothetical protein